VFKFPHAIITDCANTDVARYEIKNNENIIKANDKRVILFKFKNCLSHDEQEVLCIYLKQLFLMVNRQNHLTLLQLTTTPSKTIDKPQATITPSPLL
jgi:hypothetical protein